VKFGTKERNVLHLLSLNGSLYLLRYLYEKLIPQCQIDLNSVDIEVSTPLVLAIKNKRKEVFKYLLSLAYVNINRGSVKYGYPLHLAIVTHEYKLAKRMIANSD